MQWTEPAGYADEVAAWAESGAMWLTGRPDGPPRIAPGQVATSLQHNLRSLSYTAGQRLGRPPELPTVGLLGERAAVAGLTRQGPWSCGGAFRVVPTRDGRFGLSLARPTDLELVPALVSIDDVDDPWDAVVRWARSTSSVEAEERCAELGLPGVAVPTSPVPARRPPVIRTPGGRRRQITECPLVVDFSALWAGPLCAHLLGLGGADVIKVETIDRPDGARSGAPAFFDLLHAGHRSVAIDPRDPWQLDRLHVLVDRADLVIEASRPRALRQWGFDAAAVVRAGTSWVSLTARGRDSSRVGFGDDVAVGAGLWVGDGDEVLPCGDALADPLTGVAAAAEASQVLVEERAQLIDVSMHDICQVAATPDIGATEPSVGSSADGWWVDTGGERLPVVPPRPRRPSGTAPTSGTHTFEVLR